MKSFPFLSERKKERKKKKRECGNGGEENTKQVFDRMIEWCFVAVWLIVCSCVFFCFCSFFVRSSLFLFRSLCCCSLLWLLRWSCYYCYCYYYCFSCTIIAFLCSMSFSTVLYYTSYEIRTKTPFLFYISHPSLSLSLSLSPSQRRGGWQRWWQAGNRKLPYLPTYMCGPALCLLVILLIDTWCHHNHTIHPIKSNNRKEWMRNKNRTTTNKKWTLTSTRWKCSWKWNWK